jgi:hypothetical protein
MMKTWCFLPAAVPLAAVIIINEVYYDHPGADEGYEFVELYCPDVEGSALTGWSLEMVDGATGRSRELWAAAPWMTVRGGEFVLLGGDSTGSGTEYRLAGSLENGPDAVILLRDGIEAGVVSYGGSEKDCRSGLSLSLHPDGQFVCASPSPGSRNFHDIDLSVRPAAPALVHCPGSPFRIPVVITNTGMSDHRGGGTLKAVAVGAGRTQVIGEVFFGRPLRAGEEARVTIGCVPLKAARTEMEIGIDVEGDTNSGNDTAAFALSPSPGDVVINEIMYRPGDEGEWIELAGRAAEETDISGWTLMDRSGSEGTVPEGMSVGEHGYVVLAMDPGAVAGKYDLGPDEVSGLNGRWPRLNDGGGSGTVEELFLFDRMGRLVESVGYSSLCGDERGRSIERITPDRCSLAPGGVWLRCADVDGSTPGRMNYSFTADFPQRGLSADPDPFRPLDVGTVRFSAGAGGGEISYAARIFDIEGREIARLAAGPAGAPVVSFKWDGRDSSGRTVATGIYICIVEFTCGGGGICRREKRTLAVWSEDR